MKINWKTKLSSRKFWALVAAFVTSVLVIFVKDTETIHEITAIITAFGACVVYMLCESHVDASRNDKESEAD